jgi:hypothetical protein
MGENKEGMDVDCDEEKGAAFAEAIPQYLDLHSTLPTQAGVERKMLRIIPPTHAIGRTGPIRFDIPSSYDEQILPSGVRVMIKLRVVVGADERRALAEYVPAVAGGADARWTNDEVVIPVNGIGHAVFSDVEVRVNDQKISSYDGNYAYRGNLENLLFTSSLNKINSSLLAGYEIPENLPFDSFADAATLFAGAGSGLVTLDANAVLRKNSSPFNNAQVWGRRVLRTRKSRVTTYIDKVYSELFSQQLALPPGAKLSVQFERSQSKFALLAHSTKDLHLSVESCHLIVPTVKVDPQFVEQIEFFTFEKKVKMRYPMRRIEISKYTKSRGLHDLSEDNILIGNVVPRRVFVVLVNAEAVSGNLKLDPFNYAAYDVKSISIRSSGQQASVPTCEVNFETEDFAQALFYLQTVLGRDDDDNEIGINLKNYVPGNVVYGFDLNGLAAKEMSEAFTKEVTSPTGIEIKLGSESPHAITVIVMKEYDSEVTIDAGGTVVVHGNA